MIEADIESIKASYTLVDEKPRINYSNIDDNQCIFYKHENCSPTKAKFKICSKCHKFQGFTPENSVSYVFNRIIALAGLLIATFGLGSASGSGGAASGGAGGGGGK